MKKLIISMIVMVCLLSIVGMAYANSGSAVIPQFISSGNTYCTFIRVSNITDESISVKMTFYKNNGTILTNGLTGEKVSNFNTDVADASCSFNLEAKSTGVICIKANTNYGFGLINWLQESNEIYGLVSHAYFRDYRSNAYDRFAIPINNGLPF